MDYRIQVNIESNGEGNVDLTIDLGLYIQTHENREVDPYTYRRVRNELELTVSRSSVDEHWKRILNFCTDGLPDEQVSAINQSPAVEILEEHFAEILMNSIDETLQAHHADNSHPTVMELTVILDNLVNPNLVSIYIIDNGRGYPPDFLNQVQSTPKKREDYILNSQRTKDLKKVDAHIGTKSYTGPTLIGGHGLGMRYFLADAQNDQLIGMGHSKRLKHIYPKSEDYVLDFGNLQDLDEEHSGVIIHLVTPISPRISFAEMKEDSRNSITSSPDTTDRSVSSNSMFASSSPSSDTNYIDTDEKTHDLQSKSRSLSLDLSFMDESDDNSQSEGDEGDEGDDKSLGNSPR